eukprot:scaffold14498_cov121-Isochrysis_galbana.AAC.5
MAHHLLSIQQVEWGDPRVVFIQYSCRHRAPDPTAFFFLFLSLRHVLATLTYMCALLKEVLAQRLWALCAIARLAIASRYTSRLVRVRGAQHGADTTDREPEL